MGEVREVGVVPEVGEVPEVEVPRQEGALEAWSGP